ncbi:MAG: LytTR family DNA-binding domain-containing protein [Bacteroidetes bacterium]|nr:LytTR family DNA-binding domain-containing protein [Bacteroidota bacterium]
MIRCIAIDDEKLALDLIEDDILKVPFLQLVKKCRSGLEALEVLQNEKIDLIFLDIQMPDISGIQFLKSLPNKPLVVFTTAYEKYALEGFDLDVVDYLLKPYSFDRFLKAVNKVQDYLLIPEKNRISRTAGEISISSEFIFVKSDYKLVKIEIAEIQYIESQKDYVKIVSGGKPVVTLSSMKAIEEKLVAPDFIRVHRSFMVNVRKIRYIQRNFVMVGEKEIPLGDNYKESFLQIINQNNRID